MPLKTAIVIGAGIGGLTVATALAQRGIAVTLLEQASQIEEVGAGLQLTPNGLAVLRALGVEQALRDKAAVAAQAVVLLAFDSPGEVARLDLRRHAAAQKYLFMHRADLIDVLAQAAHRADVTLELGATVAEVLPGRVPALRLADGQIREAALIVGADGIHSRARTALNGADRAAFSGQVAWRATVPNLVDHPSEAHVSMGPGCHLVSYPLRAGRLINLVAVHERDGWAAEGWSHRDDPANLRAAFASFQGRSADMLRAVDHVRLWGLHRHPVAERWHEGNVVLLGDAAHPTLPFLAQGANMALEDAWVLADELSRQRTGEALAAYARRRGPRVARVIDAANRTEWRYHLRPGPVRWAAHGGLRLASRFAPGRMLGAFDWLYGHDVTMA